MRCNICGSKTLPIVANDHDGLQRTVQRRCTHGHIVVTHEVHTTMLADAREMSSAQRHIERRIARWQRDLKIACDPRPNTVVAAEYGLTEARVRQIRASLAQRGEPESAAIISSTNSERTTS